MVTIGIDGDVGGVNDEEEVLDRFQQETEAISQAIGQIHEHIETIDSRYKMFLSQGDLKATNASVSDGVVKLVNHIEHTLEANRKRLRRIAKEHNEFGEEHTEKTDMLRVRVKTIKA